MLWAEVIIMKKRVKQNGITAAVLFLLFCALIVLLKTVDVQAVGPQDSVVGLATFNRAMHTLTGVHNRLYKITEISGYIVLATAGAFAVLGIWQAVSRRSLKKADTDLYCLAGLYAVMAAFYVLFEVCVVNYRPVMWGDAPEASFPSSHTMIAVCVMLTAVYQIRKRIGNTAWRTVLEVCCMILLSVTVIGRLLSGVHWFTDILGGLLLGGALVFGYFAAVARFSVKTADRE